MHTSRWLLALLLTLGLSGCPSSNDDDSASDDDDATSDDDDATGDDDDATGDDDDATGDDDDATGDDDDATGDDDDSSGDDDDSSGDDDDSASPEDYSRFALLSSGDYGHILPSGRFRSVADLGADGVYRHLHWDGANGVFWGLLNAGESNFAPQIFSVDPCTGAVTDGVMVQVTAAGSVQLMEGLAVDGNGTAWVAWSATGNGLSDTLATLDTATGALSTVATITGGPQNGVDGLLWHEGVLYGADTQGGNQIVDLYPINTTTGVASGPITQLNLSALASDPATGGVLAFDGDSVTGGTSANAHMVVELDDTFAVANVVGLGLHEGDFGDATLDSIATAPVQCADDDGLVLDMPFDGTVDDVSGYGYVNVQGAGQATTDRHGNAAGAWELDGQAALLGPIWSPGASGGITVAGWFKPGVDFDGTSGRKVITSHDYSSHQVYYQSGTLRAELYDENHAVMFFSVTQDFPQDVWVHFAVTATTGGPVTIYVDNTASIAGTAPATFDTSEGTLAVGAQVPGDSAFQGSFDDLTVHDRALTAAEVSALFTATP